MITVLNRTVFPPLRGSLQMLRDKRLPAMASLSESGLTPYLLKYRVIIITSLLFVNA